MIWTSAALHLFSSGQIVQNDCNSNCCTYDLVAKRVNCDRCCGYSIHYTPHIGISILFHLFGCYWATQFFIASSSTVVAGSVASYYWAHGETSVSCYMAQKFFVIGKRCIMTILKHSSLCDRYKKNVFNNQIAELLTSTTWQI